MEEARGFRDRNLSGDIELIANAFAAQMKFWFKPETRPQYYLSDNWSSGDFYVYFSGKRFTYFLAFQPQYRATLLNTFQAYRAHKGQ